MAYVVRAGLGLDTSEYAFGYLAVWAGGGEQARRAIAESAQRIQTAAHRVLDAVGAVDGEHLRDRGLVAAPLLAVGDGALGLWAALDDVFPSTRRQRCWNHRALNVLDKLPRRLHGEARSRLHAIYEAPTRADCARLRAAYAQELRAKGQADAAACLERDAEDFLTFYDFPEEHWLHLRTTNPIESIFAGVRLRTNAARRMRVRDNALYLVFKLVLRLSTNWRATNGRNQLALLLAGERFVDGRLQRQPATEGAAASLISPTRWKAFPQVLTERIWGCGQVVVVTGG